MADYEYDFLVLIGRFQPVHKEHLEIIRKAKKRARRVIVLTGSSNCPRTLRNTWTHAERYMMIARSLVEVGICAPGDIGSNIIIRPLNDHTYDNTGWVSEVRQKVHTIADDFSVKNPKIGLIGHDKDSTTFYLKLFRPWDSIEVGQQTDISSTDIRKNYFHEYPIYSRYTTDVVNDCLKKFRDTPEFDTLLKRRIKIDADIKTYGAGPHMAVDSIIVQSDHVLMIRRKFEPGAGLLALPGGFVEPGETTLDAALRETYEESDIDLSEGVLLDSLVCTYLFDDPHRSERGRIYTNAHLFELSTRYPLPKVQGKDDAFEALWIPRVQLDPLYCFDDHYHMIMRMMKFLKGRS